MALDASLVSGGFNFLSGAITQYYSNQGSKAVARANAVIKQGNNVVVAAENQRNATATAMQRWAQQVRNSRVMENVAANQEALAINFNRARDLRTQGNFAENIRQAEEAGRQQASAAASGVTGSVVDVINDTTKLRNAMKNTARLDQESQIKSDFERQQFEQYQAGLDSLDFSVILDNYSNYDYSSSTAQTKSVASAGFANIGSAGLQSLSNSLASMFNTPKDNSLFSFLNTNKGMGD